MLNFSKKTAKLNKESSYIQEAVLKADKQDKQIEAMKYELAELKAIQSAMPDPYYVRDMDYNVILWPEAIAKLTGYTEAEAKKLKCYEMFKACVCPPGSQCPTQQCIQVKQFLRDVAVDVYHKSGATVHTLVSNAGVYDEEGKPIGAVEIVKDNTVIQSSMVSIGEITRSIESIANGLLESIEKVGEVSGAVNQQARKSLDSVMSGVQAGNSVYEKAQHSNKQANDVQSNMNTINESMRFSIEKINTLKEKSEAIIQFVTVIQDMAAKTNLLAINASIEAAHAGESGRGFKVVADGIRELSKNSSESAQSIKTTIMQIMGLIQETTSSLNITERDIENGSANISSLLSFVDDINSSARMLLEIIRTMESAANATTHLEENQSTSIHDLGKAGKKLSEIAEKLKVEFDRVFRAIQHTDMG